MITITEKAKQAIDYLRNADESRRARGVVMMYESSLGKEVKMCACAVLATSLGLTVTTDTLTGDIVERLADAMGTSGEIIGLVPGWNDQGKDVFNGNYNYEYTFAQVADMLESAIIEGVSS